MSRYYEHSVSTVKQTLLGKHLGLEPAQHTCFHTKDNLRAHLLWMVEEMSTFSKDVEGSIKAGRWIGWILAKMEELGYWSNDRSRELIRIDVRLGKHLHL